MKSSSLPRKQIENTTYKAYMTYKTYTIHTTYRSLTLIGLL